MYMETGSAEDEKNCADCAAKAARGTVTRHVSQINQRTYEELIKVVVKTSVADGTNERQRSQSPKVRRYS